MAAKYEYMRISIRMDDISKLNGLASEGWKVVAIVTETTPARALNNYALLERLISVEGSMEVEETTAGKVDLIEPD